MIAFLQVHHPGADVRDDPGALVSPECGEIEGEIRHLQVAVRVAEPGSGQSHAHFPVPGIAHVDLFDLLVLTGFVHDCAFGLHGSSFTQWIRPPAAGHVDGDEYVLRITAVTCIEDRTAGERQGRFGDQ